MKTSEIQQRVRTWVESRLGCKAMDSHERAMRMLEEALELAQAVGVRLDETYRLVTHVYGKEAGEIPQELGGAALTLLACAEGCGYSLADCADLELFRIESLPPEKFRNRRDLNARLGIGAPATDVPDPIKNLQGEESSGKAREVPSSVSTPRMHAPREESKGKVLQQRMLHEGLSSEKSAEVTGTMPTLRKITAKTRASS